MQRGQRRGGARDGGAVGGVARRGRAGGVARRAAGRAGAAAARAARAARAPARRARAAPRYVPLRYARHVPARSLLNDSNVSGKWEEAEQSIRQLASSNRWESQLLKADMYYLKGDATEALESLYDILDYCKTEDDSLHYISLRVKAMILMSQVQHSFSNIQSTNIMQLNEALWLAKEYHLHYLAASAEMHLANVQLSMGCAKNALSLVRKALPTIMADGGAYDMGRGKVEHF